MSPEARLLDEIERGAVDSSVQLADLLRKCVLLAGRMQSAKLLDWASKELEGYAADDELPEYRRVTATLMVDGTRDGEEVTGRQISKVELPWTIRNQLDEPNEFRMGIGLIQAADELAGGKGAKRLIKNAPEIINFTNRKRSNNELSPDHSVDVITNLYWSFSKVAFAGALDGVRTQLARLVAEIRLVTPTTEGPLTGHSADQAVNVVVNGGKRQRISVNTSHIGDSSSSEDNGDTGEPGWWTHSRKVGAVIVGIATVAAAVFAYLQL